jgi:hypothetical protein
MVIVEMSGSHGYEYEDIGFWDVALCSLVEVYRRLIALMMEAASTSETSVNFYQTTRRNIPEGSRLNVYCCFLDCIGSPVAN